MPIGKLFTRPEVSPIIRDNDIIRPTLTGRTPEETAQAEVPVTSPLGQEDIVGVDPFSIWINEILDTLINKSVVLESEAISLQNKIVSQLDLSLVGAPDYIPEILNNIVDSPIPFSNQPGPNVRSQITECEVQCLSKVGGLYGEQDTLEDRLQGMQAPSASPIQAFENEAKNLGPKVTGLWLFFFMVRFIVAYAVHVTLGFMCCYLKNKLKLRIGPFKIRLGIIIARPIGALERILKDLLGFPCASPEAPCLEPGKIPTESQFSMFQCCQPNWESCGGARDEDSESSLGLPSFTTCFQSAMRKINDFVVNDGGNEDGRKACIAGDCEPNIWGNKEREQARNAMDWFLSKSQALKDSLNEEQIKTQAPQMEGAVEFFNSPKATDAINTSRSSRTMTTSFKSSFNQNYEYNATFSLNARGSKCGLDLEGANPFAKLNDYGNLTQDDILNAFKNNVDTDFTDELRKLEAQETTIVFDGSEEPEFEPFRSIYQVVKTIDSTLGSLLDEMRKTVVGAKMLSNLTTDRIFCCVIYAIVILGNLIKYKKACPEKDMAELFDYAQDFGSNGDVQKILKFLKLLEKLLDALNAELAIDIEFTGVGLPLGTMLELLKKGISQSIVALLAIALAPIDGVLTELENQPRLKALLNDDCFGIGDLFNMFHCGIKWIYDLIKKWTMELIPYTARNIELLGNFRITAGFKMSFLSKLQDLIKLLIDLLIGIGDCYPPENVALAIMDKLPDQEQGPAPITLQVPNTPPVVGKGIVNYQPIPFEQIGNKVIDDLGREVFKDIRPEIIEDYKNSTIAPDNTNGFPIFSEAIKIGFVQLIEKRNGLNLVPAETADIPDQTDVEDRPVIRADIGDSREKILGNVLNMVENLKRFK